MTHPPKIPRELASALQTLVSQYKDPEIIKTDPIVFVSRYKHPLDQEIVALLSSLYAYGQVKSIQSFLSPLLTMLGPSPYETLAKPSDEFSKALRHVTYYRFQTIKDNQLFLKTLADLVSEHKQHHKTKPIFESMFLFPDGSFVAEPSMSQFQRIMIDRCKKNAKDQKITPGILFLLGDPKSKSAKKRLCLFLRWMVRTSFPDFGLYSHIAPNQLLFPLDVHIQRLIRILGISSKKTFGIGDAREVSNAFCALNPSDPLLYDFYLTRVGMIQKCKGTFVSDICSNCSLRGSCFIGSATGN